MSELMYRPVVDGPTFDYYMGYAGSTDLDMPDDAIVEHDASGDPVGFFIRIDPFWGEMYDGTTLYQRGAYGGTDDQTVGYVLRRRPFVPVRDLSLVVARTTNVAADSDDGKGF